MRKHWPYFVLLLLCLGNSVGTIFNTASIDKLMELERVQAELVLKLAGRVYLGEDIDVKISK